MACDAVRDLINRLLQASQREGSFSESLAIEIERQWRHDYHGAEIFVSTAPRPDEAKRQAAVKAYLAGEPIAQVTSKTGISRATLYRLLKR